MPEMLSLEIESALGRRVLQIPQACRHERLSEILRRANVPLNTRCGQRGLCDGCEVELLAGTLAQSGSAKTIRANERPITLRACECKAGGEEPIRIRVPARSLLAHRPEVLTEFRINVSRGHDPLAEGQLGAAIDVGTTTVAVLLVDLASGEIVSEAAAFNQQLQFGDDVVTRITLCCNDPSMVRTLQQAVALRTIAPLLAEALEKAHATPQHLVAISVAGNTTMLHLLAAINPAPMGTAPFTPTFLDHRILAASEIFGADCGSLCRPETPVHLLPGAAAYVGADLCAGIIASGLLYDEGPSLLVDAGTNGEIILKHAGKVYGCATAAGPAFEGAGLSCGIRAGEGAITHLALATSPFNIHPQWINHSRNSTPVGLCGSAYIDFLSEARRIGLLTASGRFDRQAVPDAAPQLLNQRHDLALRIATAADQREIVISELDISRLLQAKAAIAAGILTLLQRVGLSQPQIKTLYLAGGFGSEMDPARAIGCGLLPGFAPAQVQTVGNASLAGAYLALLDRGIINELSTIGRRMQIVELNLDGQFESRYIDQLLLPEPAEAQAK
jgi:uncharacterized 2Fe-2S/4Fe-4S cluster protein (DUF4445 family)